MCRTQVLSTSLPHAALLLILIYFFPINFIGDIVYEGDFKNNEREGHDKLIYNNGYVCEGEWKDDVAVEQ
jgi:hypothetical protein